MSFWNNVSFIQKPFTVSPSADQVRTNYGPVPLFPITSGTAPGTTPVVGSVVKPSRNPNIEKIINLLPSIFSDNSITHMK